MTEKENVQTQVCGLKPGNHADIVIGFDFGTSSSKIIFRDMVLNTAYAVPFGGLACPANQYLIPTQIFISNKGKLSLSEEKYSFKGLKTRLLDHHDKPLFKSSKNGLAVYPQELVAAYIGLVIQYVRAWFLKHTKTIYMNSRIHWWLNIGIPSKNYDDEEKKAIFKTIGMAAWRLSTFEGKMSLINAKQTFAKAMDHIKSKGVNVDTNDMKSLWIHPDFVNPYPEVIMEVVGYVRSPSRTNGLHLLIDVGATTLDCAAFNIDGDDGEDKYELLKTRVEKYGTMVLHNRRMKELKNALQKTMLDLNSRDPIEPCPEVTYYEIHPDRETLSKHDNAFFKECLGVIGNVVHTAKNQLYPNAPAWQNGLPVFICGGGGRYRPYKNMVGKLDSNMVHSMPPFEGFIYKKLPIPDKFEAPALPPQEYDRLAVAYGLSFSPLEIGQIFPESQVENPPTNQKTYDPDDHYPGKELT